MTKKSNPILSTLIIYIYFMKLNLYIVHGRTEQNIFNPEGFSRHSHTLGLELAVTFLKSTLLPADSGFTMQI